MPELKIEFEWVDPLDARAPEIRATWSRLRILVDDVVTTRLLDERVRTVRDDVYVPAYPLAEWFATSWWLIWSEMRSPWRMPGMEYEARHSMASAREGFALPALTFEPVGDFVCLRWEPELLKNQAVEFVSGGRRFVKTDECRREVAGFVDSVVARLDELGIGGTLLQEEWTSIARQSVDETEYCQAAASLGKDPYSLPLVEREALVAVSEVLPKPLWADFFSAASAETLAGHAEQLQQAIARTRESTQGVPRFLALREIKLPRAAVSPPWHEGFEMARSLRAQLGAGSQPLSDSDKLASALGFSAAELGNVILSPTGGRQFYDAVLGPNKAGTPVFVIGHRNEQAKRFHFCRGLLEYIVASNGIPALMTRAPSERQQRSRAFAAEFLAPASALRERVGGRLLGSEDVEALAIEFGVSSFVIGHQLENHRIASVVEG